jgi:hypothetical protein
MAFSRHITVCLDRSLAKQAKREATRREETLTSSVELPVCSAGGGTLPFVDLCNSSDLLDRLEDRKRS